MLLTSTFCQFLHSQQVQQADRQYSADQDYSYIVYVRLAQARPNHVSGKKYIRLRNHRANLLVSNRDYFSPSAWQSAVKHALSLLGLIAQLKLFFLNQIHALAQVDKQLLCVTNLHSSGAMVGIPNLAF